MLLRSVLNGAVSGRLTTQTQRRRIHVHPTRGEIPPPPPKVEKAGEIPPSQSRLHAPDAFEDMVADLLAFVAVGSVLTSKWKSETREDLERIQAAQAVKSLSSECKRLKAQLERKRSRGTLKSQPQTSS